LAVTFAVTLLLGMPIAFSIGFATLVMMVAQGFPTLEIAHQMFNGLRSFPLLAMPMFILAGDIMLKGEITRMLVDMADLFVGRLRGSLGHINVVASMLFAGITGMATADTTAIGSMLIPAMVKKGYDRDYSTAITIASSVIGPIIPPSLTFVIYALAVGQISIAGLFLAGALPGVLTGIGLMIVNHYVSWKRHYEKRAHRIAFHQAFFIIRRGILALLMPIIILGGIIGGIFTVTEAAGVACVYALIVSGFVFRTVKLGDLPSMFLNTVKTSAIIGVILGTSKAFSWMITTQNIPQIIGEALTRVSPNPLFFLAITNITLLAIGTIIDTFPAIIIFAPIFHPIALSYGIHPLHFGVIMCVNLLIGLNTPPVGTGLFLGCAIGKVSIEKLIRAVAIFTAVEICALIAVTYVPSFSLWIPRLAGFIE
jgi:tripartite ATP-independent transporter DctM subunit